MQKKLIALAVAGLVSGGAFAQSNVTIYGILDIGFESSNSGYGNKFRIQSGQSAGSRLGFKGAEDLGGGNSVIWTLETGFALDNGQVTNNSSHLGNLYTTGAKNAFGYNSGGTGGGSTQQTTGQHLFQRQAWLGMKGNWGQMTFGRQYAPEFLVQATVDPFIAGLGGNNGVVLFGLPAFTQRLDNSVLYMSPNLSGFTFGAGYSSGGENNTSADSLVSASTTAGYYVVPTGAAATPAVASTTYTNDKAARAFVLMAQYANGPAYVGFGYHDIYGAAYSSAALQTGLSKAKSWLGGASWDFKVVKLSGTYFKGDTEQPGNGVAGVTAGKIADVRGYTLGLQAPMGNYKFNFVYGKKDDKSIADKDFKTFSIGGEYALSKRTSFYAAWTKLTNVDRTTAAGLPAGAGININSALNSGLLVIDANYDPKALQAGVRHSF